MYKYKYNPRVIKDLQINTFVVFDLVCVEIFRFLFPHLEFR